MLEEVYICHFNVFIYTLHLTELTMALILYFIQSSKMEDKFNKDYKNQVYRNWWWRGDNSLIVLLSTEYLF